MFFKKRTPPVLDTHICTRCWHTLVRDALYCHVCGEPVAEENAYQICLRCASAVPLDAHFCHICRFPQQQSVSSSTGHFLLDQQRKAVSVFKKVVLG